MNNRVRIQKVETLSDDWYTLKKTTFDYLRNNGTWQTQSRETYDRGNGATVLLYNLNTESIVLTRQFRLPAYVNGLDDGMLMEAPAGLLEKNNPEEQIKVEVEEETGYRITQVEKVYEAYMSPGSVTEKLFFFIAEYSQKNHVSDGGGIVAEGEDIEVLELKFSDVLSRLDNGDIQDGKTIMLIQYAAMNIFKR